MNFAALKTELSDRGFAHLSAARRGQIVNDAIVELEELHLWPFREQSGSGLAPLSVADLGVIEAVTNESQNYPLEPRSYQFLLDTYGDLSTTGTPLFFYVAWPSGDPVVATYPVTSDTVGVQYWRNGAALSGDSDVPLTPDRYHSIILAIAQRMAENERGNLAAGQGLQVEIDRQVNRMVEQLLGGQQNFGPGEYMRSTGASEDG